MIAINFLEMFNIINLLVNAERDAAAKVFLWFMLIVTIGCVLVGVVWVLTIAIAFLMAPFKKNRKEPRSCSGDDDSYTDLGNSPSDGRG